MKTKSNQVTDVHHNLTIDRWVLEVRNYNGTWSEHNRFVHRRDALKAETEYLRDQN